MQCLRQGVLCTPAASSSRASLPVSPLFLGRGSSRISGLSVNEGLQLHRVQWKFPSRTPHTAAEARGSNDSFAEGGPTSAAGTGDRGVMGAAARAAIMRATRAVQRYGWISFWVQLSLSVVSAVILLFSVAFTSQSGPKASLYLTLVGILAGFLSTFWNFGYTRTGIKMQRYIDAPPGVEVPKVKKQNVMDMVTKGVIINVLGLGSTLLGIQALVGVLVAKTLANASANPFIASAAGVYNPVLALDVFLVQAATNMLLGHFLSLTCSLWLLNVVGEGRGDRFQRFLSLDRLKKKADDSSLNIKGTSGNSFNMSEGARS
uniref:Protein TIC 21, chloroplastic n=1 Tax=Dunaliella tertiolecta TaxID=3047 RepID=A0A7S3VHZ7_DUNTE|mmetsp:Transcript_10481/g.27345  ORF Transcript_10481/g.27345 Transcript_10481/m.27345 type:complete len:318 (+) Transcript_10481:25-978(+)|eukprot:CAMPEP_0202343138 /NCGR_PEP_ID=MMETSP1126-20121109/3390_1 /ASSEMBLY_ACC=CAM_ASM_000457 /TAXON_ID=3047 /ORGANISM="Dunaliella tertiolecta, Strain CCMP1320" /LENGTH=317 /DNA_ID=CAMNT_0048934169 /DNA_START=21 /DNA_END=974 /DNA_ORIENTATION=-